MLRQTYDVACLSVHGKGGFRKQNTINRTNHNVHAKTSGAVIYRTTACYSIGSLNDVNIGM